MDTHRRSRRSAAGLGATMGLALALGVTGPVLAAGLAVTFTSLPIAYRDNPTTASVKTMAGARCTIR